MFTANIADTQKTLKVYNKSELIKSITDTIDYYEYSNKHLQEENKKMRENAREEVRKEFENEISYLRERLRLSYGSFTSQKELDAYEHFNLEHMHDRKISKYNGGKMPYLIPYNTGLSTILHVKCPICGEEKDITDNTAW